MAAADETCWGIAGVTQRSPAVAEALRPQDCLYSVLEPLGTTMRARVVGSVRDVLFAQRQPDAVTERLSSPATRIVTLTVSEKGYRFDPSTGRLRSDDPQLLADAAGAEPTTVLGQLVRGLEARWRSDGPSVTVVCCDNLPSNGDTLSGLVREFCHLRGGPISDLLLSWVSRNVTFPNTMVDRIVPAATDDDRATAAGLLGLEDRAVVVAEPFSQWVIEDRFAGPRPAWERAGAMLVPDVGPYEVMKLRLLNGSHSALAYLGALAGFDMVCDAFRAPGFAGYVQDLMDIDVAPTLDVPAGFDLAAYKAALMGRFGDPAVHYRTAQVAGDGSQKLPYRLLRTISSRLAEGEEPRRACLAVAAWMRYVSARASDSGAALSVDDPLAERIGALVGPSSSPAAVVTALLSIGEIFPPALADHSTFRKLLTEALESLVRHGSAASVAALGRR
jgi:fructuronate reductase